MDAAWYNLSTDIAITLTKQYLREMAQALPGAVKTERTLIEVQLAGPVSAAEAVKPCWVLKDTSQLGSQLVDSLNAGAYGMDTQAS